MRPALPSTFADTLDNVTAQMAERMTHGASLVASICGLKVSPTPLGTNIESAAFGHAHASMSEDISTAVLFFFVQMR